MTIMSKRVNIISSVGVDGNDGIGNIGIHILKSDSNIMDYSYDMHFIRLCNDKYPSGEFLELTRRITVKRL
jgi:hypothetical protein